MNQNKKPLNPFISLIFLPLLISAIWEKILSPLFDRVLESVLSISNSLFTSISNHIYTEISNGVMDRYSPVVCSCLFGAFCAVTLFSLSNSYMLYQSTLLDTPSDNGLRNDPNVDEKENALYQFSKHKFLFYFSIIIAVIAHLSALTFLIQQSYVTETALKLTNDIEIVSPYISDLEYKQLKSDFHSMQSRFDYDNLVLRLETIGSENHLRLK